MKLYGKSIDPDLNADLKIYQNLLLYSYLRDKKNLNVLHIGEKKLISLKSLKDEHKICMLGFEKLCKNQNEINPDDFVLYTKYDLNRVNSNFDLIFLPSSKFTEETDLQRNEIVFSNLKYLLKPGGILLCSFTNVFGKDSFWYESIFNHFAKQKNLLSRLTPFSRIAGDPDLFYLTEKFYLQDWVEFVGKTYGEFGTAFCNNLIFEKKIDISQNNFDNFVYPKKSHSKLFADTHYPSDLFKNKSKDELTNEHLRSLTVYAFIKNNFEKGSKLLCIGKIPEALQIKLKEEYSLHQSEMMNIPDFFPDNSDYRKIINNFNSAEINDPDEVKDFYNYFDFIFSFHDEFPGKLLNPDHQFMKRHINNLLKPDGVSLISFKIMIQNNAAYYPFLLSYLLKNNVLRLGGQVKRDDILKDQDLLFHEVQVKTGKDQEKFKTNSKETFYNLLFGKEQLLPARAMTRHSNKLDRYPVYVFHHLMKCGGTSLFNALDQWFKTIDDNILDEDLNSYVVKKYNTEIFHSDICLRAHFQKEGIYLHQRYPELLTDKNRYRVFTFIRDPLSVKISKYYFLKSLGGKNFKTRLKDSILKDKNFLSGLFPCNESNFKEMLDRYFFIGVVEKFQESFDVFADKTGKKKIKLPKLNISEKDSQMQEITPEFKNQFRDLNELDYKIYEYCLSKFKES